ncbi:sterol desaturase family protein [Neisseriaceae bacterium TC5R-5]|nr:sterol desaturase family protein [Neisseriaceae bacterium TC5R-5]
MAVSKRWQLSPLAYFLDFLTIPLLFGLALWLAPLVWWQLPLGVLAWSLLEYLLHRYSFHVHFRRDHWAHHVDELAHIGISGWLVTLICVGLWVPAYFLHASSVFAGFMLGYFAYLTLHYSMHRPDSFLYRFIGGLAHNHALHHQKGIEMNFGVTLPLWDRVFATYTKTVPVRQQAAKRA